MIFMVNIPTFICVQAIYVLEEADTQQEMIYLLCILLAVLLLIISGVLFFRYRWMHNRIIDIVDLPVYVVENLWHFSKLLNASVESREAASPLYNLAGLNIEDIVPEKEDLRKLVVLQKQVLAEKKKADYACKMQVGVEVFFVRIRMVYRDSEHMYVFLRDVTRTEIPHQENEKACMVMKAILENQSAALILQSQDEEEPTLAWNKAAAEIMGISDSPVPRRGKDCKKPLPKGWLLFEKAMEENVVSYPCTFSFVNAKGKRYLLTIDKTLVPYNYKGERGEVAVISIQNVADVPSSPLDSESDELLA